MLSKRDDLIAVFFHVFLRPEGCVFGFADVGDGFFDGAAGVFAGFWIPLFQKQGVAFVAFPVSEAQFIVFLTVQNFLKVFRPNFFFVVHGDGFWGLKGLFVAANGG